jgi:hypothetical protein
MVLGLSNAFVRRWHGRAAAVCGAPLLITVLSGAVHRLAKLSGVAKGEGVLAYTMWLHEGRYSLLGISPKDAAPAFYTFLICATVISLAIGGLQLARAPLFFSEPAKYFRAQWLPAFVSVSPPANGSAAPKYLTSARAWHNRLSSVAVLILVFQAVTGTLYRLGRFWGVEKGSIRWLMQLHGGNVLPLLALGGESGDAGPGFALRTFLMLAWAAIVIPFICSGIWASPLLRSLLR